MSSICRKFLPIVYLKFPSNCCLLRDAAFLFPFAPVLLLVLLVFFFPVFLYSVFIITSVSRLFLFTFFSFLVLLFLFVFFLFALFLKMITDSNLNCIVLTFIANDIASHKNSYCPFRKFSIFHGLISNCKSL